MLNLISYLWIIYVLELIKKICKFTSSIMSTTTNGSNSNTQIYLSKTIEIMHMPSARAIIDQNRIGWITERWDGIIRN